MAGLSGVLQHPVFESVEQNATGSDNDDEFDLLIDALSSIDRKLNSIDVNTRQCEDEHHTMVRAGKDVVFVHLQINISSIEDVDTVRQEFTCQFFLGVSWEEPQLKYSTKDQDEIEWDKCWDPRIYFQNVVEIINMTSSTRLIRPLYDGNPSVQVSYRVKGRFKTLFDLKDFPFDKQRLEIRIVSKWADTVVQFKESSYNPGHISCRKFLCEHEWILYKHVIKTESCTADDCTNDHSLAVNPNSSSSDAQCRLRISAASGPFTLVKKGIIKKALKDERPLTFSVFTFSFSIRRKFSFFITNVVVLLALISFLALGPFCVPQSEIGDRLSIIFTLLLTAVTFKFVVSQSLPKVSYQTLLDQYVLCCIVYIFAVSVIIGLTTKIKFLQVHEQITFIISSSLWLAISLWLGCKSVYTINRSNAKMRKLEGLFRSQSEQSSMFQSMAATNIKDIVLPKLSPETCPLRISESTASANIGQPSMSHTMIGIGQQSLLHQNNVIERRSTLANVRMKNKKLKLRARHKMRKTAVPANVISDKSGPSQSKPAPRNRKILVSSPTFSSSGESEGNEIVLTRYVASFSDEDETSDRNSEPAGAFASKSDGKEAVNTDKIEMKNMTSPLRRASEMQG